jgi:sortase A
MDRSRTEQTIRWTERALVVLGAACLIWVGSISIYAVVYQSTQNSLLDRVTLIGKEPEGDRPRGVAAAPLEPLRPIGRLEISRVGLSAIVAEGDDESTLAIAVGHLSDTPLPWQDGNAAFAGHRDTFFRPLRRIQRGDEIRLETRHGTLHYRVTRQTIVEPHELWVLEPSPIAALTLITCYPFNFVGPAPRRFVVHAERIARAHDGSPTSTARGGGAA